MSYWILIVLAVVVLGALGLAVLAAYADIVEEFEKNRKRGGDGEG